MDFQFCQPKFGALPVLHYYPFCFNEYSEDLNNIDVLKCSMSKVENQTNATAIASQKRFLKRLTHLEEDWLNEYDLNISILERNTEAQQSWESEFLQENLNKASNLSTLLKLLKGRVEHNLKECTTPKQRGSSATVPCLQPSSLERVEHKVRICEKDEVEFKFRLYLLLALFCVLALASFATYRLHKIADYKVKYMS